jgi:S1 RNA binding domain protein
MALEEGDIVLCTVDRIAGTLVFVRFFADGEEKEGSINFSEIAPGRIRNIRDYVVPKKKIVCKILRISKNGNINLSLRRVTQKEQKEIMAQFKQEKSYASMFKTILGEDSKKIIQEINKTESLFDFVDEIKKDSKKIDKLVGKENAGKILEILNSQKQKKVILKKEILLNTSSEEGIKIIKEILTGSKDIEIKYISAGKYSLKTEAEDIKKADNKLREIIQEIEKQTKKDNINFSVKEK